MFWLMIACSFQGKWLKTMEIKGRVTTVQLSPSQSVSMGRSLGLWTTRPKLSDGPPPHRIPHAKESPQPARSASSPPASSSDPLLPCRKSPHGKYNVETRNKIDNCSADNSIGLFQWSWIFFSKPHIICGSFIQSRIKKKHVCTNMLEYWSSMILLYFAVAALWVYSLKTV